MKRGYDKIITFTAETEIISPYKHMKLEQSCLFSLYLAVLYCVCKLPSLPLLRQIYTWCCDWVILV